MKKSVVEFNLEDNININGNQIISLNINNENKYDNIKSWGDFALFLFQYLYQKYPNEFVNRILKSNIPSFSIEATNSNSYKVGYLYFNLPVNLNELLPWIKSVFKLFNESVSNITFKVAFKECLTWIGNVNPSDLEQEIRDKNKICQYCEENNDGEFCYICSNKVSEFEIKFQNNIEKIWINNAMLCPFHLNKLSTKYKINFSEEIPKLYLEKGWMFDTLDKSKNSCKILTSILELENTKLYKSLQSNFPIDKERVMWDILDPEKIWFRLPGWAIKIPKKMWDSLTFYDSTLKKSSNQGLNNGPDFILKNDNNELIGLEIVSFQRNIVDIFNEPAFSSYANKEIYNAINLDDKVLELEKILDRKEEKSKKYCKCKELYLCIVTYDTIMPYENFVLELIINAINKKKNHCFKNIFIL